MPKLSARDSSPSLERQELDAAADIAREEVRISARELLALSAPAERRLLSGYARAAGDLDYVLYAALARMLPDLTITLPEPWAPPARPGWRA